jgi:hypothetical protein
VVLVPTTTTIGPPRISSRVVRIVMYAGRGSPEAVTPFNGTNGIYVLPRLPGPAPPAYHEIRALTCVGVMFAPPVPIPLLTFE